MPSSDRFRYGLVAALWLRLPTQTAASGDSDSQDQTAESLRGFYLPGAMRAPLAAVLLRTRRIGGEPLVAQTTASRGDAVVAYE